MACLVKATYLMEKARIKCRMYNDNALAPAWWESFGFSLYKMFIEDSKENDWFTYGAIFENKATYQHMAPEPHRSAPVSVSKYVVAFRGTMLSHPKAPEELAQDSLVIFNALPEFKRAHFDVNSLIGKLDDKDGCHLSWLAGHSLGASLALGIGRDMMMLEKKLNVPTFLFNPPHVSSAPVIDKILKGGDKTRLYDMNYTCKFVLAKVLSKHNERTKEQLEKLTPWVPELYVNPKDLICQGHIDYFEQRELVGKDHPRRTSMAERSSYRDMVFSLFGKCENAQSHLLPSARLWKNTSEDKKDAHALRQWWKPDSELELTTKRYSQPLGASP